MQGQLGLNKKKPIISIRTSEDEKTLLVHIGFVYYTSVPNDPTSVQYRLLVGQLALAGFSIASLMEVFGFSRPTIMRYREIVRNSTDETALFSRLRGYHCEKTKLRPDVEAYIKARFPTVYGDNRASYNSQLREELFQNFEVKLSPETVRRIIAPLRQKFDTGKKTNHEVLSEASELRPECSSVLAVADDIAMVEDSLGTEANLTNHDGRSLLTAEVSGEENANKGEFHVHAGLLVLNLWLADFIAGLKSWRTYFLQWFYQIFAGAVNLEQSRYLAHHELSRFIGQTAASVSRSRLFLSELAHHCFGQCLGTLFEVNLKCISEHLKDRSCYFYVDGHFDPYYGIREILKGWNCILNRCMKGSNHYTIHDAEGYPLVKELKDCLEDFRAYIKQAIQEIKSFMLGVCFGIVFDRGGFSEEMFRYFDAEGVYFITWEKYFDINKESALQFDSCVTIEREINEVGHFKCFDFKCAETVYRHGETFTCRKLIIHTEKEENNGQKDDFYASILTNDPFISHQTIVELMTGRWSCQENDYKYQKKHFGLDQITSYDVSPVPSIQPIIDEQKGRYEALKQEQNDVRAKREPLLEELGIKRLTKKRVERIEKQAEQNPQDYECLLTLRAIQPQLQQLQAQLVQQEKKVKRLEKIEKKGYVKLDYRKKQIFDHIKFSARNIFYNAIAEFRQHYTNLRDLHVVFRKLIRAPGVIQYERERIKVTLLCPFFEGKALEAVESFLEVLNQKRPILLDGAKRIIVFDVKS